MRSCVGASSTRTCCGTGQTPPGATCVRTCGRWPTRPRGAPRPGTCARGSRARTGFPFVDAGMRQFLVEGWVHNRVRMVVASFLVKDLHIWRPHGGSSTTARSGRRLAAL
ncbi:FAD-binding domain-containing protein [Georgenia sp. SYP-B2076]|uniref:FAD-binding domain-containing protein n=1 Tax=Georgenia sp. SYP-B2076 TaxID=2495881 RepID=UPI002101AF25|nr:FAD-binding domain-containing protein [Georgenia sp. SYP-B2076]